MKRTRCSIRTIVMIFAMNIILISPILGVFYDEDDTQVKVTDVSGKDVSSADETRKPQFTPILLCDEEMTKTAYPMDLVVFNCTVKNGGNMVDDYKVKSTEIPGWNIILYPDKFSRIPPLSSPANEADKIKSLTVRAVVGDLYSAKVGRYNLDVTLISQLHPSNRSTLTFTIDVLLLHRLDIITPQPQHRLPGEQVMYEFQVQNLGNGDDRYDVWIETSDYEWVAILVDPGQADLRIQQGRIVVIPIQVILPFDVDAGTAQITTLCARAKGDDNINRGFVQTLVKHIYDIEVNQGEFENVLDGIPGGYTTFGFSIMNTGNDLDDIIGSPETFKVSEAPTIPTTWETWLDTSDIREEGLPKDLEADIEFKVKVPPSTPVKKYSFTVDVYSDIPQKWQDEATFVVDVKEVWNAEMEFNISQKVGHIGDNISFDCLLRNIGNIRDKYTWEIESDYASWTWIEDPTFTVDFGDTYRPEFHIKIPNDTPAGTYEFKLVLGSMNDQNITFYHTFNLIVADTLDFAFEDISRIYDVIPGGDNSIKLMVSNAGNADVTLSFDIHGESWGLLGKKNLFLKYQESKPIILVVKPPKDAALKGYTFEIVGRITVGADVTKSTNVNIRVVKFEFAATDIYLEDHTGGDVYAIKNPETVNLYVDILNNGNQFFDSEKFGQEITVSIYLDNQKIYTENIKEFNSYSYERIEFNYTFKIPQKEESKIMTLEARIENFEDDNPSNNIGSAKFRVVNEKIIHDDEEENGSNEISTADWVLIFMIMFIAFVIILLSIIVIKRKYSLEKLVYDAKGDYDFDKSDAFMEDEMDVDELTEEDRMIEQEKNIGFLSEIERARFGAPPQGPMQGGFHPGAQYGGGFYDQGYYQDPQAAYYQQPAQQAMHQEFYPPQEFTSAPLTTEAETTKPRIVATSPVPAAQSAAVVKTAPVGDAQLPRTGAVPAAEAQKALPPAGGTVGAEGKKESIDIQGLLSSIKRSTPVVGGESGGAVAKTTPVVAKTAPLQSGGGVSKTTPVVAKTAPLPSGGAVSKTAPVVAKTAPVPTGGAQAPSTQKGENVAATTKKLEDILAKLNA